MSNIRVTYSGLIAFVIGFAGVITGILFVIIVTRQLSPEEFGLWTLIGSLVSYVVIVEPIVSYWTTRQIARGETVGKTSVFTSGLFSIGGFFAYLIIAIFVSDLLKVNSFPVILAAILVPIMFLNNTLSAIGISHKPQGVSYSILSFEVSKLPFGFGFVYLAELGLVGAIVATIIASLIKTIILLITVREQLVNSIKKQFVKFWLKLSWIPLYANGSGLVFTLDVLVFSLLTNSLIGLAFWGVSNAAANLVAHSGNISQALGPKLLATQREEFAQQNLKRLMFFAIPLFVGSIVFAKPMLHVLNPLYIEGIMILYLLSVRTFFNVLMNVFFNIIVSLETVDIDGTTSFKKYLKSKLFFIPTLNYLHTGSYVGILAIFLIFSASWNLRDIDLVTIWAAILLITTIPFMLYSLIIVQKHHKISLPYKSILKLSSSALISSIIIYIVQDLVLVYEDSVFDFLPQLIPLLILGGGIYFGIAYVLDASTRTFVKTIIEQIKPH